MQNHFFLCDTNSHFMTCSIKTTDASVVVSSKKRVEIAGCNVLRPQSFIIIVKGATEFLPVSDQGCSALRVDPHRPRALPQVLQLFGRLADALLKPPLDHRQHGVMEEGSVLQDEGLLLRVLLTAEAVVHVLHGH